MPVTREGPAHQRPVALARPVGRPSWSMVAVPVASLSTFLAWGAVAPVGSDAAARIAIVSTSWPPLASALVVLAAGAWLHARGAAGPLWLAAVSLVPWLPLPTSAAVLLWHGPAGLVPMGLAALLVAWPLLSHAAGVVLRRPARQQAAAALLAGVALYGIAGWRMQPQLPGGDEPHYLVITQSLLLDGDLRIENNHRRGDYRAYTAQELRPDVLKRGKDGQIYSVHAPGTSVLVAPAFALGGYGGVVAWLVFLSAIGAAIAWWAAWRLTGDAGAAWVGWGVVAPSAPFLLESFAVFPDGPGAVLVMACACALVAPGMLRSVAGAGALGAAAAMLPWLHTRYAVLAGVLGVLLSLRLLEERHARGARLAAFFALPAVSAAAWFGFFHAIYGTFNPAAPYGGYTQSALGNAPRGLTGLLLDQQFGVLPNAPAFAVALVGVLALWRLHRRVTLELGAIVLPYAVAVACYHMWWGGRSAPARFLVPILLPLALPAAALWQRAGRTARAFAGAAVFASAAIAWGLVWVDRGALAFNVRDGYALWLDAVAPLVRLPLAAPSFFRGGPLATWTVALAWVALTAAALSVVHAIEHARAERGEPIGPGAFRTLVAWTSIAAATAACGIGWVLAGSHAVDEGSALVRVARMAEASGARAWRSSEPWALASPVGVATLRIPSADRRPTDPSAPAWTATDLPPGRYEIWSTSGLRVSGRVAAFLGRQTDPLMQAVVRDAAPGRLPLAIELPGGAASLRVVADGEARRSAGALELRLSEPLVVPGRPPGRYARTRLEGAAHVWLLDDDAFPEPSALWVRGGAETALVVDPRGRACELVLRAGPVPTTVSVAVGGASTRRIALGPAGVEVIALPAGPPTTVRLGSSAGFRPREHEATNPDSRWLGVRVELR